MPQVALFLGRQSGIAAFFCYKRGMRTPIFQIDTFTSRRFAGNPAAVMPLEGFLPDEIMRAIAAENNLSETAFLVASDGGYRLRWFTPMVEVPLCGHATLTSAAAVMERLEPSRKRVVFHTASGALTVTREDPHYVMDLPARPSERMATPPQLVEALGAVPVEVRINEFNYMALLESESTLRALAPDMAALANMERPGVIVTARCDGNYDFVSRYFAPAKGIPDDPATGAAHCMLAPYWAERLGKREFRAFQASRRGGELICRVVQNRVELKGECVVYLQGEVEIWAVLQPSHESRRPIAFSERASRRTRSS
jgi:PhzF family phenazine biosynthesis protein